MRYLLDTNAVIAVLKGNATLIGRLRGHNPSDIAISAIVAHELYYGASKSSRKLRNVAVVDALQFPVVEFDRDDARASGEIRGFLSRAGTPIGPYDILIAGQAVARTLTLVTNNISEFQRVPALNIEDWLVK